MNVPRQAKIEYYSKPSKHERSSPNKKQKPIQNIRKMTVPIQSKTVQAQTKIFQLLGIFPTRSRFQSTSIKALRRKKTIPDETDLVAVNPTFDLLRHHDEAAGAVESAKSLDCHRHWGAIFRSKLPSKVRFA